MEAVNWSMVYGLFSFMAGIVSVSVAIYLSPHLKNQSIRILVLLLAAVAVWSLSYGMEFIRPNLYLKLWWVKAEYFGAAWMGALLFSFVMSITGRKWHLSRTGRLLLNAVPIGVIALVLTNESHHLMWKAAWLELGGRTPVMAYLRGPAFWVFVGFSYGLLLAATLILARSLLSAKGIYKKQLITILVGIVFPWFSNSLYLFGIEELKYVDLTPASFTISCIAFAWGLLRYQKLSLIPLAHDAVIQSLSDPVIALDKEGRILDINRAGRVYLDLEKLVPAHQKLEDIFPGLYEQFVRYRQDGPAERETDFFVQDGKEHWNLRIMPLLTRKEKHMGWLIILRDITDQKTAEKALKESERNHRIMLEASPNPIVFYDELGTVTYLNPAFTRVFGWRFDELAGKRIDFVPPENQAETETALQKTLDPTGGRTDLITRRYTKDGKTLDVSINAAPFRSRNGRLTSLVVNFTDITQIKRAERELLDAKNYIRNIINSMPSMIVGLDSQGMITHWNTEANRLTGILPDLAEGQSLVDVFPKLSGYMSGVREAIETRTVKKETKVRLPLDQRMVISDITIYPILSESVEGAVIRVDDISERVKIEEMMVQSEKMLSVGGLAAGMAHEINNPLAGIIQNTQVIRNRLGRPLPANLKAAQECGIDFDRLCEYMEKRDIFTMMDLVKTSGQRAAQIVSNMLSFSRKSDRVRSSHYLHQVMEATIDLVKNDYNLKKRYDFRSIEIIKDYQENTPPVSCGKNEIQQVFLNILKNGAEAMADAGIASPCFEIRIFRQSDEVVVQIRDNGPGLDSKTKSRIFEPFFTTKEVGVGTGLGLSVSYFIIAENHGGVLAVESAPGEGTAFIIRLPFERQKSA